jgi:hypothetical protein
MSISGYHFRKIFCSPQSSKNGKTGGTPKGTPPHWYFLLTLHLQEETTMNTIEESKASRKQIGIRFLYTLLYLIVLEVIKVIVQVTVILQFLYLLITQNYSEPLRSFSNKLSAYAYRVIRYATLNENTRPFPFNDFPGELEKSEEPVQFT